MFLKILKFSSYTKKYIIMYGMGQKDSAERDRLQYGTR
jgi:hypothetical protein